MGACIHFTVPALSMLLCAFSDICLQPGSMGGIEADSWPSHDHMDEVDDKCNGEKAPLSALQNGLCPFIHTFVQLLIMENNKNVWLTLLVL